MMDRPPPRTRITDPDAWIDLVFSAKAAQGGVVRRAIGWVGTEVGHDRFIAEVKRRGFHLLVTQSQYIVVCNPGPVRMLF
ncbi:MAG: N-(5'-phosphoribosyl)anthranilate isomerase [Paracoccaceae bacterium]|nr:N-(5'-phosphoribosyl)anthranilate isomerase [Paracoccaceae bacterium]